MPLPDVLHLVAPPGWGLLMAACTQTVASATVVDTQWGALRAGTSSDIAQRMAHLLGHALTEIICDTDILVAPAVRVYSRDGAVGGSWHRDTPWQPSDAARPRAVLAYASLPQGRASVLFRRPGDYLSVFSTVTGLTVHAEQLAVRPAQGDILVFPPGLEHMGGPGAPGQRIHIKMDAAFVPTTRRVME